MKTLTAVLGLILVLFVAVPAQAAKNSNTPTGTIELLAPLEYGKPVVVHWTFTGRESTSPRLRVQTQCFVNGDIVTGWADSAYYTTTYFPDSTTPYLKEHVVYEPTTDRSLSATSQQLFAGYGLSSLWDNNHATENADCTVTLYEWKHNLANQVFVYYDSVTATAIR